MHIRILTLALLSALSAPLLAQTTIDQNKALAGNITPGDAPGFPIQITRPGHYKLTGNLTVPAETWGIIIAAHNVTLDLNGFVVTGAIECWRDAGRNVTCNGPSSSLAGIGLDTGQSLDGAVVRNGTVRGFGIGLRLNGGGGHAVYDLHLQHNSTLGAMLAGRGARAERLTAMLNGGDGVYVGLGALGRQINASLNHGEGITGNGQNLTLVQDSSAVGNRLVGIANTTAQNTLQADNGIVSRSNVRSAGGNTDPAGVY